VTRYLTMQNLLDMIGQLGIGPIADLGLLDSALSRPGSFFFGTETYPALERKAAALMDSLCSNHGLVDGQKRMALTATIVFLQLNGHDTGMTQDEAHDLTLEVAAGLHDLDTIANRLKIRTMNR
jgi:death-on-curing protein